MTTRCQIIVGDEVFYHRDDGYPSGVGDDLAYYLANHPDDSLEDVARALSKGIPGALAQTLGGLDSAYIRDVGKISSEIDYLYIIAQKDGKKRLYYVHMPTFISKDERTEWTEYKGYRIPMAYKHPVFRYKPSTLRRLFCVPGNEIPLPRADLPKDLRLYYLNGTLSRKEAESIGLYPGDDNGYGKYCGSGLIRVRSARKPSGATRAAPARRKSSGRARSTSAKGRTPNARHGARMATGARR